MEELIKDVRDTVGHNITKIDPVTHKCEYICGTCGSIAHTNVYKIRDSSRCNSCKLRPIKVSLADVEVRISARGFTLDTSIPYTTTKTLNMLCKTCSEKCVMKLSDVERMKRPKSCRCPRIPKHLRQYQNIV
jgi:hypothetical protein